MSVAPVKPYRAAIDKDENVWVWGGGVSKIDAKHNVSKIATPPCAYGITVDPQARVWVSGQGCIARYTPQQNKWDSIQHCGFNRGLAVDGKDSVWVADTSLRAAAAPFGNYRHTFLGCAKDGDGDLLLGSPATAVTTGRGHRGRLQSADETVPTILTLGDPLA